MSQFIVYALVFLFGAMLVRDERLTFTNLMITQFGIMFGAFGAGMAF